MPGAIVNASLAARELFAAEKRGEEEEREREREEGASGGQFLRRVEATFFPSSLCHSLFLSL